MQNFREIKDPDTGSVYTINSTTMIGDVRDVFLSRRRLDLMATTWKNLGEEQQKTEIATFTALAEDVVNAIVELVAQAGHSVIDAELDTFGVNRKGVVKIVALGIAEDDVLLALNRVGKKKVKISVADVSKHDQHRDKIFTDPDQSNLFADPPQEGSGHLTEGEVADIGEEMDQDLDRMDASDRDQIDHGDSGAAPQSGQDYQLSPKAQGYADRLNGKSPDECPYDVEADEIAWAEGYDSANAEVEKIIADARAAGDANGKNPWPKGSASAIIWDEAFKVKMVEIENDATTSGYAAARQDAKKSSNPHKKGTPHFRFWNEGFEKFWAEPERKPLTDEDSTA